MFLAIIAAIIYSAFGKSEPVQKISIEELGGSLGEPKKKDKKESGKDDLP